MEVDAAYKKRKRDEDMEKAKQMKEDADFQKQWTRDATFAWRVGGNIKRVRIVGRSEQHTKKKKH